MVTNKKITKVLVLMLLVILWTSGVIVGLSMPKVMAEPMAQPHVIKEYITLPPEVIYKRVEVPVEVIKEVEIVTQEVPVEVVKEVPIEVKGFESVIDFEKWVENNHGLIAIDPASFNSHDPLNDCEDQADRWQRKALEDGYFVSACPVYNGMVFDTYVGGGKYHVGLWTSIGNNYYYWDSVTGAISKLGTVRD